MMTAAAFGVGTGDVIVSEEFIGGGVAAKETVFFGAMMVPVLAVWGLADTEEEVALEGGAVVDLVEGSSTKA